MLRIGAHNDFDTESGGISAPQTVSIFGRFSPLLFIFKSKGRKRPLTVVNLLHLGGA
jgi:hypothetical protein